MKRDQIIIYALVGVMVFSAVATGLLFVTQDNQNGLGDTALQDTNQDISNQEVADIMQQQADLNDQIPSDRFLPDGQVAELVTEDLAVGTGQAAAADDTVTVHYTGWLASDGTIFDSSHLRGEPATFPLTGVIAGWTEGIPGMKIGGKRRLVIPADMAYGPAGSGAIIGPNADLVFEVELIEIE